MTAMLLLIVVPGAIALIGTGGISLELRHGFTSFFSTPAIWPALLIGVLYAGLCFFGTRIYLDRRENTFCIPLNRCSSLLSAIAASFGLTLLYSQRPPGGGQLVGAALIIMAILILSPLHHFRRQLSRLEKLLAESQLIYLGLVTGDAGMKPRLIEGAVNEVKEALKGDDAAAIKTASDKLNEAWQAVSAELYKAAAEQARASK